jgi:hypothetical protein
MFFFEKKNQKTFATPGRVYPERPKPKYSKVFCFFFSKKKALLQRRAHGKYNLSGVIEARPAE